jgi:hypothetical protein
MLVTTYNTSQYHNPEDHSSHLSHITLILNLIWPFYILKKLHIYKVHVIEDILHQIWRFFVKFHLEHS